VYDLCVQQNASYSWPKNPVARVVLVATMLTAVLYLLFFNLGPGAPLRQNGVPPQSLAYVENVLADADSAMMSAAANGPGHLQLHFGGSAGDRASHSLRLTEMYFSGNYTLYPRRVVVGKDDRVINSQDELLPADVVPDDRWLKLHGVAGVFTITPLAGFPGGTEIYDKTWRAIRSER
jgi:hypothetical protein